MRTILLLLGTLVLLVGGFLAYFAMYTGDGSRGPAAATAQHKPQPVQETDTTYTVRGGKDVWLKEFDEARRLTTQFRAEEFNPQKEGFVRVKKPEAHFFLKGGQWIRVTGDTGDVVVAGLPETGSDPFAGAGGLGGAAPSRGRLQNVHMQLYETAAAQTPTLEMEMNNAAFDNESFRIFTEGYTDETGRQIAADQVKVTVRGKYEFDGRGLTIRWNDRDRRLELLEIAHGERLVVKDPGALGSTMPGGRASLPASRRQNPREGEARSSAHGPRATARQTSASSVEPEPRPPSFPRPSESLAALASADPTTAVAAAAADKASKDFTLYSIWFYDNVQVVQAEQTLATGNVIEVFYAMRETPEQPATAPAAQAAPAATQPDARQQTPSTQLGDSGAATQPAEEKQQPVIVYWTGKLRIVPSQTQPPAELAAGESAIQIRGTPVVLTRDNVQIRCPLFTYRTTDGGVTLNNSDAFPQVEIAQFATIQRAAKPELMLLSEWVEYAPEEGVATLGGKSKAVFPADESRTPGELAQALWTREGIARFTGSGNQTVIKTLDLSGDVDVQHPQVLLKSQRLNLAFDPPAVATMNNKTTSNQPVVRQVVADDAVHCVLLDENGRERELHGDHLEISTAQDPARKLYPKLVNARGNVRALQEGRELKSQELAILLAPAAASKQQDVKPAKDEKKTSGASVELQRLVAKTNVRATSADGGVATGETLVVTTTPGGKPQVGLSGQPARVENAQGTVLTSSKIIIPNPDEAQAIGAGTLHALVQSDDPKAPPRHMDATWTGSALVNSKLTENQVQVVGDVRATMPDADGTVNTASADRILITLVDKAADPADAQRAKRKDAKKDGGALESTDVDVLKGKQVSRIMLNKDAVVNSRLAAADGTVLREMQIDSSLLHYHVLTRRLVVPRPGRMLVRDHRPPDAQPAAVTDKTEDQDGLSSQRGATAFQWAEELDYNGVEQRATMKGEVLVAYKPDAEGELPVRLRADEVVAIFEESQQQAKVAAAAPASKDPLGMQGPAVQLRSIRAEGNVNVVRGGEELTAPRLTYDPVSHWIRAIGNDQTPAVFSAGDPGNTTTAREFQWNTQTWKMRVIGASGRAASGR